MKKKYQRKHYIIQQKKALHHTTKESKKESNPTSYNIRKQTAKESSKAIQIQNESKSNFLKNNMRKQKHLQKQYKFKIKIC